MLYAVCSCTMLIPCLSRVSHPECEFRFNCRHWALSRCQVLSSRSFLSCQMPMPNEMLARNTGRLKHPPTGVVWRAGVPLGRCQAVLARHPTPDTRKMMCRPTRRTRHCHLARPLQIAKRDGSFGSWIHHCQRRRSVCNFAGACRSLTSVARGTGGGFKV